MKPQATRPLPLCATLCRLGSAKMRPVTPRLDAEPSCISETRPCGVRDWTATQCMEHPSILATDMERHGQTQKTRLCHTIPSHTMPYPCGMVWQSMAWHKGRGPPLVNRTVALTPRHSAPPPGAQAAEDHHGSPRSRRPEAARFPRSSSREGN